MAEAIVSVVLEQLASILRQQADSQLQLVVGVDEEIQTLTSNLEAVQAVLEDADNKRVKEKAVERWLEKLQGVSYDIDDVLDEWNTEIGKLQLKKPEKGSSSKSKVCSLIPSRCFSPWQKFIQRRDVAIKIKELNKKLANIAREKEMFGFSSTGVPGEQVRPITTTSFSDEPKLFGRDQDSDTILSYLFTGSCQELPFRVISVVGMGGLGKTALARVVFASGEVNVHFDKKIWVCVADPFDELRIGQAILKSLDENSPHLVELQVVLKQIHQLINGKRFLLVLDDVWTENPRNWEQLKGSLRCASQGSRILVTTRKEKVAKSMGTANMVPLGKLSNEACWSLFSQLAFFGRTSDECEKLVDIGKLIVERCDGLPLAAKTLGSLLNTRETTQQWQSVLNNDIWKLEEVEEQVFLPLLLSYFDLSSKLRKCFSYCVIFPKDYELEKDVLIKLWMAQDYLRVEGREDMEVVGEEYFENLAKRSFFQDFKSKDDGRILTCKMHDIVHDFAKFLSKKECFIIDDHNDMECQIHSSSKKIRHLMIKTYKIPIFLYNKNELRSLILASKTQANSSKLFDQLTCLRTLNLSDCNIKEILRGIKKLIHLRYLNLSQNRLLKELPEAMCDLYNLQTLDVNGCWCLEKLPEGMVKLINLRHLINHDTYDLRYMPRGVEKLINLRTLNKLAICSGCQDNEAYSLDFLKNLNNPRVIFELRGLGNISEIKATELKSMKNVLDLTLSFDKQEDANVKRSMNEQSQLILDALQPPPNLVELSIVCYEGKTMFPHWMVTLTNLTTLKLSHCMNCECLPPLGKLSALEYLKIGSMESVKRVDNEFLGIENGGTIFPRLKNLTFWCMEEWEEWNISKRGDEGIAIMPCLQSLYIYNCNKLKSLPDYILQSTTLSDLTVSSCSILISAEVGIPTYRGNTVFPNVTKLTLSRAHNCESLPPLGNLLSLESLTIKWMDNVERVGNGFLGIESGSNINPSIIIFPNLKYLEFEYMRQWEEWQITTRSSITIMPCLQTLIIRYCYKLKALPDQILRKPTLQNLEIRDSPILGRRYRREAKEWSKISHIHCISMS